MRFESTVGPLLISKQSRAAEEEPSEESPLMEAAHPPATQYGCHPPQLVPPLLPSPRPQPPRLRIPITVITMAKRLGSHRFIHPVIHPRHHPARFQWLRPSGLFQYDHVVPVREYLGNLPKLKQPRLRKQKFPVCEFVASSFILQRQRIFFQASVIISTLFLLNCEKELNSISQTELKINFF